LRAIKAGTQEKKQAKPAFIQNKRERARERERGRHIEKITYEDEGARRKIVGKRCTQVVPPPKNEGRNKQLIAREACKERKGKRKNTAEINYVNKSTNEHKRERVFLPSPFAYSGYFSRSFLVRFVPFE
jgi:hypothetical protein